MQINANLYKYDVLHISCTEIRFFEFGLGRNRAEINITYIISCIFYDSFLFL